MRKKLKEENKNFIQRAIITRNAAINIIAACDFLIWSKDTTGVVHITLGEKSMDFTSSTPRSDSAVLFYQERAVKI